MKNSVSEALDRLKSLADARNVPFEPTADLLWQIAQAGDGVTLPDPAVAWPAVEEALRAALRGLTVMRAKEGESLLVDFLGRVEKLRQQVEAIATRAPQIAGTYREQLMQRLRTAGLELDVNDERVLKEVALFADRSDVSGGNHALAQPSRAIDGVAARGRRSRTQRRIFAAGNRPRNSHHWQQGQRPCRFRNA